MIDRSINKEGGFQERKNFNKMLKHNKFTIERSYF